MVIGRAGASTVSELTCAGRPAILVPLPSATDNHQSYNVKEMVAAGGARAIAQPAFTAVELAKQIQKIALEPGALENAAKAAKSCGRPNAVSDLADLVESFGRAPIMHGLTAKPDTSASFEHLMKGVPTDIGIVHFVGIGGIGMSGIAEVMHNLGYK
eukprot:gene53264-72776_t